MVRRTVGCAPTANLFVKTSQVAAGSRDLVMFDDNSVVMVTESDLEGYDPSSQSAMASEIWADLSVVYRVRVAGQAALARISCLWLRYATTDQKISSEKLSSRESSCSIRANHLGEISVDIHVYWKSTLSCLQVVFFIFCPIIVHIWRSWLYNSFSSVYSSCFLIWVSYGSVNQSASFMLYWSNGYYDRAIVLNV